MLRMDCQRLEKVLRQQDTFLQRHPGTRWRGSTDHGLHQAHPRRQRDQDKGNKQVATRFRDDLEIPYLGKGRDPGDLFGSFKSTITNKKK
jgi:hypothetical protein